MGQGGNAETVRIPERVPRPEPLPEPPEYGAFERGRALGVGGSARVYEAVVRTGREERRVALKLPFAVDTPETRARFAREAETWAALSGGPGQEGHDGIVALLGWGAEPRPWLALEHADGGSLRERLDADAEIGLADALWVGVRLADALWYAHRRGVAHLDLSPRNVLFRRTPGRDWDVPKVSDWGLARALLDPLDGGAGLSPGYAAPEQFDPGRYGTPDERADVYALGTVLYELTTGERPFGGRPKRLMEAVLSEPPRPPTAVDPTLPADLDAVLGRALAKRPDDRYASMLDFRRDVERVLAEVSDYRPADDGPSLPRRAAEAPDGDGSNADSGVGANPATGAGHAGVSPSPGLRTAIELEDQGFVHLDGRYFDRHEPVDPVRAWRTGFDFADVWAGYALDRRVDGEALTGRLTRQLAAGGRAALVGPPGAGRSTVCKQVACAWVGAGRGSVWYRASGTGTTFERPVALERWLRGSSGHTLVVVEDAPRPEANGVFRAMAALADREDVSFLLDARAEEWYGPEAVGIDAGLDAYRTEAVEVTHLPYPDWEECARLVEQFDRTVRGSSSAPSSSSSSPSASPTDVEDLLASVRDEGLGHEDGGGEGTPRPGALLLLVHRLVESADPWDGDRATPTTFAESVQAAYAALRSAAAGDGAVLDVGLLANLLNAAGLGVRPELLYAAGEPTAVEATVDALRDRLLFDTDPDDGGTFRTAHEAWSTAFLAHALNAEDDRTVHERVGRSLTRVLALADPDERDRVDWALHGDAPYLERVGERPSEWVGTVVEAVFTLALRRPKLAPLFGATRYSRIEFPAVADPALALRCACWRGRAYLRAWAFDRAEREFEELARLAGAVPLPDGERERALAESRLYLGKVAWMADDLDASERWLEDALEQYRDLDESAGIARCWRHLGSVARKRGEFDLAESRARRALEGYRELGDERGEAEALEELGLVARVRGAYDDAQRHYRRSLECHRACGDAYRETIVLNNLGVVAYQRDDLDSAAAYHERGLRLSREIGSRRTEVRNLYNRGLIAHGRGDMETAAEHYERSLDLYRELGDDRGRALCLNALGNVAEMRARLDRAETCYEESLALCEAAGDPAAASIRTGNLGTVARKRGDLDSAERYLTCALDTAREVGSRPMEAAWLVRLGTVARERGDLDSAERLLDDGLCVAREVGSPHVEGRVRLERGRLGLARGELDAASAELDASRRVLEAVADPWETAALHVALGDLALARGSPRRARKAYECAVELATGAGMTYRAIEAAERLVEVCRLLGAYRGLQEASDLLRELTADTDPGERVIPHRFEVGASPSNESAE